MTTGVIILEPWKWPGYIGWNTQFAVDPKEEPQARVILPIVVEDMVFKLWEEGEYQLEVLEDKYFPDECGDHFDILQSIP